MVSILQSTRAQCPRRPATATGASNMDGGGSSESGDWKPAQVEMRRAPDGVAYTRQEFLDLFGGLDEWHAVHVLVETRSLVGSANVLRPSKHGQAYQCPECSVLFNCATQMGTFLDHIKCKHPGAVKPNRKDEGVIVDVDADGHVLKNT